MALEAIRVGNKTYVDERAVEEALRDEETLLFGLKMAALAQTIAIVAITVLHDFGNTLTMQPHLTGFFAASTAISIVCFAIGFAFFSVREHLIISLQQALRSASPLEGRVEQPA